MKPIILIALVLGAASQLAAGAAAPAKLDANAVAGGEIQSHGLPLSQDADAHTPLQAPSPDGCSTCAAAFVHCLCE